MKTNRITFVFLCVLGLVLSVVAKADERIISVGVGVSELLEKFGVQQNIVAVDITSELYAKRWKVPLVGYHRKLSTEGLLSLQPTLLVGSDEMGPETVLRQLTQAHVKVEVLTNTQHSPQDLIQNIQKLGRVLKQPEQAQQWVTWVKNQLEQLKLSATAPKQTALFLMLHEKAVYAGGSNTTVDGMLQLLHLTNLAQDKNGYYPYSLEQVLKSDPDVVFISERSLEQNPQQILQKHPFLQTLRAVKNRCFYTIHGQALLGGFNLTSLAETLRLNQALAQQTICIKK